jgi:hypothetical protein
LPKVTFQVLLGERTFFEGIAWNDKYGVQAWIEATAGAKFHDFAGSHPANKSRTGAPGKCGLA